MAESNKAAAGAAAAVPAAAVPHDRVTSLSLRSDGTPDQNNPELIGDKEGALAATREQFAQFAVSAVDQDARREAGLVRDEEGAGPDAAIDKVKAQHEKAAKAAESAADAIVNSLFKSDSK